MAVRTGPYRSNAFFVSPPYQPTKRFTERRQS
ncbi:hypothetical protein MJO28_004221 [Puccinia striiformis f. sp. tritici]|uniref:Uncharacterized protein n=1 Tax=Puccinia striiformis f. sp. tritici TaxID=168172 RepID=A0ACC0ENZ5_9BASI|nr:hypothetical protein MJO28_004221 [Puccinia striiformis f. sp. tritici]